MWTAMYRQVLYTDCVHVSTSRERICQDNFRVLQSCVEVVLELKYDA